MPHPSKKTIIIGGGAAGFFCAVNLAASDPDMEVCILEKTARLLSKVKVSGGGRCNVTNGNSRMSAVLERYPRGRNLLKKAFRSFSTTDTRTWFESRGISLKEEADGRVFPESNDSGTIIACLLNEAATHHVDIQTHAAVTAIEQTTGGWLLTLQSGQKLNADFIVWATGGHQSEDFYRPVAALGHPVIPPLPSLFTFNIKNQGLTALAGISVPEALVRIAGSKQVQQGPLLITHWGISGPAVLSLSAYAARDLAALQYQFPIIINWLGHMNEQELNAALHAFATQHPKQQISNSAAHWGIPARLWHYLLQEARIPEILTWNGLQQRSMNRLINILTAYPLTVTGKTTFKEEFVTAGGIDLSQIEPSTMESKLCPGLYFAGEVMDIDGVTGGYNFQNAWTTGFIAAETIAAKAKSAASDTDN